MWKQRLHFYGKAAKTLKIWRSKGIFTSYLLLLLYRVFPNSAQTSGYSFLGQKKGKTSYNHGSINFVYRLSVCTFYLGINTFNTAKSI